ncbi:MAG TPA: 2-amino-4-hydroxy-6-hydroxymethyldihydropteridine diphosphokinase [Desulfosarcina sp.]|nr:2-amino-4-hydroxy-6-hydroxymethyldihydropteridine diphosphokinase [Desulfosarcina sp.]
MADLTGMHTVFLSVGSNMGDKLENCLMGIDALTASGAGRLLAVSRFFRTSPVDYTDQDWFVNAAVKIATRLSPDDLLAELLAIQRGMGRKADAIRFGPRVLDLDILLYDDRIIRVADLEIPHPRMHKRAFVLQPICDIDPAIVHPVLGRTAADLLAGLDDADQRVIPMRNQPAVGQGRQP